MTQSIPDRYKVSPGLVFFLVTAIQLGVGILSFQSVIVLYAGYDSWISIILAGIGIQLLVWLIYKIMNKEKKDIFDIHRSLFGKWVGTFFGIFLLVYFLLLTVSVLRIYIEVIQVWMFPQINIVFVSLVYLILVFYIVNGGFRTVAGICFLGFVIPLYLVFTLLFPLEFAHFENLLPVFNHTGPEYFQSAKIMTFSFIGISTILVYYPYIKHPERSQKWAHAGVLYMTFIYLATAIVTFVFYNEEHLKTVIWPTLGLWKIIEMPFVERFEYIGISSWALVILPNMCLSAWAFSKGAKKMFGIRQRKALVLVLLITLFMIPFFKTNDDVTNLEMFVCNYGLIVLYIYIPFIFVVTKIVQKVRKR